MPRPGLPGQIASRAGPASSQGLRKSVRGRASGVGPYIRTNPRSVPWSCTHNHRAAAACRARQTKWFAEPDEPRARPTFSPQPQPQPPRLAEPFTAGFFEHVSRGAVHSSVRGQSVRGQSVHTNKVSSDHPPRTHRNSTAQSSDLVVTLASQGIASVLFNVGALLATPAEIAF